MWSVVTWLNNQLAEQTLHHTMCQFNKKQCLFMRLSDNYSKRQAQCVGKTLGVTMETYKITTCQNSLRISIQSQQREVPGIAILVMASNIPSYF